MNKTAAFTLIELLLYIAVTSVIMFGVSSFLIVSLQSRVKNQTIAEVEQQGAEVMAIVTQTVRNAKTVSTPAVGASASSLTVTTFVPATSPTVFDSASSLMQIKEGVGSAVPLTSTRTIISGLSFTNVSRPTTPGAVRIQFTLSHVNTSGRNETSYSKTFYGTASLRNQ